MRVMTDAEVKKRILELRKQRERAQKLIEVNVQAEQILQQSMKKESDFTNLFSRMDDLHKKMDQVLNETGTRKLF
jgi:CRISPR/Cas system-associated endonuclease Cas3-HD